MDKKQRQLHQKQRRRKRRRKQRKKNIQKIFLLTILILAILILWSIKMIKKKNDSPRKKEPTATAEDNSIEESNHPPKNHQTVLEKAKSYSETMHLSKVELYQELIDNSFTHEEAHYAVDFLLIDYKENALLRAKDYQKNKNMSADAIYKQLVGEFGDGFTPEEAQYAVDHL